MSLYTNSSHPGKILHPRGYLTMSEDIFEVITGELLATSSGQRPEVLLNIFCSVAKSCLTLRDPMDCRRPGFPVRHHLLEFAQVHVH